jgi:hypothetical protein
VSGAETPVQRAARAEAALAALEVIGAEASRTSLACLDVDAESGDWHGTVGDACAEMATPEGLVLVLAAAIRGGR